MKLIEVLKISTVTKRTVDGSKVKNPLSKTEVKTEQKTVKESIRLDEIKSCRPWHKSIEEECSHESELTMLYLIGDKTKEPAQMKIAESYESFTRRAGVIKIEDGND